MRPKVVVVGGGIAGLHFIYNLRRAISAEIVLIDQSDFHEFSIGIPIALAGLVQISDLLYPFSQMDGITFIKARVSEVEEKCVRITPSNSAICGDYVVLAPGGRKIGSAEYWNVNGAVELFKKAAVAKAVRFVVNVDTPVIGFQEIAFSLKTRFPEKDISIHLVYINEDYLLLLKPWRQWAKSVGLELSDEPPPLRREGELYISVPTLAPSHLAENLEVNPVTFETQYSRVYLIGDSSLVKLSLPPIGWGALWQATTLAKAIANELQNGVFEVNVETWDFTIDKDRFYRWLTYRMTSGTPLVRLKRLYDLWKNQVLKTSLPI